MRAIERATDIRLVAALWKKKFSTGANEIGYIGDSSVLWHHRHSIWGVFSTTRGRNGISRAWNGFGETPINFRSKLVVEINHPPSGIDKSIQGVFAIDKKKRRWLLHRGRMSVVGHRVTETDFRESTGLRPVTVEFSDRSTGLYHPVADIDAEAAVVQDSVAAFIERCAWARLVKRSGGLQIPELDKALEWERKLSPEITGEYEVGARDTVTVTRVHAEVWSALSQLLKQWGVKHSNERVSMYGPDLYTWGNAPKILFEIKTKTNSSDIFEAVGQLHIYDLLLGGGYRRVFVVPKGMAKILQGNLSALGISTVEYSQHGRKVIFNEKALKTYIRI